ncbi:MAG: hypothetical protein U9N50_10360 [Pseudomonadota bacterium]|nr:hypothetical protein [Pseudomonadota bacterium]
MKSANEGRNNSTVMTIRQISLLTTAILSCSSNVHAAENQSFNLRPSEVHESCHDLAAGAKLNYSFESSSMVLFNIHYHRGKEISYPVAEKMMMRSSGTLSADSLQTYCLMWSNSQGRTLTLRYKVDIPVD